VVAAAGWRVAKVILGNAYLNDEEKVAGCRLAEQAGAHFVKTSTGFAPGSATLADIRRMRATVPRSVEVKAAWTPSRRCTRRAGRFGATATEAIPDAQAAGERGEAEPATPAGDY
jgi:deoxyribose-phosphate aldolase